MESLLQALGERFGVTRVARVTDLDRTGVEVCAAARPRGHVLQVSQGKGLTLEHARWSALGEAIELAVAEQVDPTRLVYARRGDSPWAVGDERIAWVEGRSLATNAVELVPAHEVYCPPAGQAWLGPASTSWRSNGLGFHPTSRRAAVGHAVNEVLERDALAHVLPGGWTCEAAVQRLSSGPPLLDELNSRGFASFCFDLSWNGAAVAGALLFDLEGGPVPLTAGYACRASYEHAALAALLEAAQSRLTEIHGAREDVTLGAREAGGALLNALRGLTPRRRGRRATSARIADVIVVTLSEDPWVVKAVSPSRLVSDLLL